MSYVDALKQIREQIKGHIKKTAIAAYQQGANSLQEIFVYPNFDGSTVCIELFTPKYGNEPAQCHMLHVAKARKFVVSPDWSLFSGITVDQKAQQQLIKTISDTIDAIDELED